MIKFKLNEMMGKKKINNKTQFAADISLGRSTLNDMLFKQPIMLHLSTIEKLCRKLNCLPNDLLEITNEDGTPFVPKGK